MKNIKKNYLKTFNFLVVKFSMYLNRRVFVMYGPFCCNQMVVLHVMAECFVLFFVHASSVNNCT